MKNCNWADPYASATPTRICMHKFDKCSSNLNKTLDYRHLSKSSHKGLYDWVPLGFSEECPLTNLVPPPPTNKPVWKSLVNN